MSKNLALIVAVLMGVLAVGMVYTYTKRVQTQARVGLDLKRVIVAKTDLLKGSVLDETAVAAREYASKYVEDRSISENEAATAFGAVIKNNIQKGAPILWSDLIMPEVLDAGLAGDLQHGMNAMTIPVTVLNGLSGMLKAGMKINILCTLDADLLADTESGYMTSGNQPADMKAMKADMASSGAAGASKQKATVRLLQNVLILATGSSRGRGGQAAAQAAGGEQDYNTITLELTPMQAQILTFCMAQGQIGVVLRKAGDTAVDAAPSVVTFDTVHDYLVRPADFK